ncbi:MAG TPA: hypothetical protein EYG68_09090 [Leucothrix mucor]|nr:hypothetical protein [Leucothrix mucor]
MSRITDEELSYNDVRESLKQLGHKSLSNSSVVREQAKDQTEDQTFVPDNEAVAERDVGGHRQQMNLPDPGNNARFEVAGREWPADDLSPSVCMWHDDKLAAFSVSIDDNHVDNHAYWLELAANYGWRWTWFVITNNIGSDRDDWPQWQNLVNLGHDVQSHTCSHLCDGLFDIRKEYQISQSQINNSLSSNQAITLAYPFGYETRKGGSPCASVPTKNNRQEAARRYIAARDVVGALVSPAKMDFMKIPSMSELRNFFCDDCNWAFFDSLFDQNSRNYRSWYNAHLHHVGGSDLQAVIRQAFNHVRRREPSVWVGKFCDVAKYAQEYATASIHNLRANETQMTFDLHDEMNDRYFDFPLTIKIKLPSSWRGRFSSVQNNREIENQTLSHHGQNYALVYAVPDKGRVMLRKG